MAKSLTGSSLLLSAWGAQGFVQPQLRASRGEVLLQGADATANNLPVIQQSGWNGESTAAAIMGVGCSALMAVGFARKQRANAHGHSRTALRAVNDFSLALPWAPVPENLTNKPTGTAYIGDVGFDPAGFAKNKRLLPWYREAELAHGRVCMLATLGYTVQSAGAKWEPFITRFPTSSEDPLLAATQVPFVGWFQILAVIGLSELWRYENVIAKYSEGVMPGDLGWNVKAPVDGPRPKWFGPTFTAGYTKGEFELMQLREIKHCRLAMFGFFFFVIENANGVKNVGLIPNFELPEYAAAVGDFIPKNL